MKCYALFRQTEWCDPRTWKPSKEPVLLEVYANGFVARKVAKEKNMKSRQNNYFVKRVNFSKETL